MDKKLKLTISWVLIGLCLLQIGIFVYKYIDVSSAVKSNPLIPQDLDNYVLNFTLGISAIYCLAMLPNIYYIIKRRNFGVACILSVAIIVLSRFFLPQITEIFSR